MKKLIIAFVLLISIISFTGCGSKSSKTIVGKWALGSYVYTFNEDNTCSYDIAGTIMKCTYKADGKKLSITYDGNTATFDTNYSINGNKLNIKDSFGNDTIYTRK